MHVIGSGLTSRITQGITPACGQNTTGAIPSERDYGDVIFTADWATT